MTVWCVEDDASIRDIEIYTLKATGFSAQGFADAGSFREALRSERPDLVLLDVMLPGEDGVELLVSMKNDPELCGIPVIMATAKGMEYDKIQSLDLGADDYLVKPFGMMEMVSRVKAVLRCSGTQGSAPRLEAGGLLLNPSERTVYAFGERVNLTFKEFELLRLFLAHPGIAFSREQLFQDIWGDDYIGESRTVDMHIRTLRKKLGSCGSMIETVRGVGYRLEVPQ